MADYESRANEYGFAMLEEIQTALANARPETTIIFDVRSAAEITADGRVPESTTAYRWVHIPDCSPDDCPSLRSDPKQYLTSSNNNNNQEPTTVIIHCKSGRRARTAQKILLDSGAYGDSTRILNAGGYMDIAHLFPQKE